MVLGTIQQQALRQSGLGSSTVFDLHGVNTPTMASVKFQCHVTECRAGERVTLLAIVSPS